MAAELIRIFSDIHYGDRVSRVHSLAQLRPLLAGVTQLVLNGDTFDTRPCLTPELTAQHRAELTAFFASEAPVTTFITGNHDADFSAQHLLDLAGGRVFVTHGDILHADIVPWSQDAPVIGEQIAAGLAALPAAKRDQLDARLSVWRRVAASIPQRHQSETRGLRYWFNFARDTIWPPSRVGRVLRAWHGEPKRAAAFLREHRPAAAFIIVGHTHRPGVWRTDAGVTVINTGSFCRPLGGYAVDLTPSRLAVRRVELRGGEFHPGAIVAEFSLADAGASPRLPP